MVRFETARLFANRRHLIALLLWWVAVLVLLQAGICQYRALEADIRGFLHLERQKVGLFSNFEQFAAYGFKVVYQPRPVSVFFHGGGRMQRLESNVSTIEDDKAIVLVNRALSIGGGLGLDFAGAFLVFGSLIMVGFGVSHFHSRKEALLLYGPRGVVQAAALRLALLLGVGAGVLFSGWLYARLWGVRLGWPDGALFLGFSLYALLLLGLFFVLGTAAALWVERFRYETVLLLWLVLMVLVPELEAILGGKTAPESGRDAVNMAKLQELMAMERRAEAEVRRNLARGESARETQLSMSRWYLEKGLTHNDRIEEEYIRRMARDARKRQLGALCLPTLYYSFTAAAVGAAGPGSYLEFLSYLRELKVRYIQYYVSKRFFEKDLRILPFARHGENIFTPTAGLPPYFPLAVLLLAAACVGGLAATAGKWRAVDELVTDPVHLNLDPMEKGGLYFVYTIDEGKYNGVVRELREKGAAVVERWPENSHPDTTLDTWLEFECGRRGISRPRVEIIGAMLRVGRSCLRRHSAECEAEVLHRLYLAMALAGNPALIVFQDFFRGFSRRLEKDVAATLRRICPHVAVIYVSTRMPEIINRESRMESDECRLVAVDLEYITLR